MKHEGRSFLFFVSIKNDWSNITRIIIEDQRRVCYWEKSKRNSGSTVVNDSITVWVVLPVVICFKPHAITLGARILNPFLRRRSFNRRLIPSLVSLSADFCPNKSWWKSRYLLIKPLISFSMDVLLASFSHSTKAVSTTSSYFFGRPLNLKYTW